MDIIKSKSRKTIIIALLLIILILVSVLAYFLLPKVTLGNIKKALETRDEYTLNLEEFIVNLKADGRSKAYLKTSVSLMYTDKKSIKTVETSVAKIRDIVLSNLRVKTAEEMLDVGETDNLRLNIIKDVNKALGKDVIEEVYFTNLVVQ